jgi:hypothetical protein
MSIFKTFLKLLEFFKILKFQLLRRFTYQAVLFKNFKNL